MKSSLEMPRCSNKPRNGAEISSAKRLRRHATGFRRALDLLAVLVGAGEKEHVIAEQPPRSRDRVGDHRRVRVAEMRLGVHVIDRRGQVEASHGSVVLSLSAVALWSRYAFVAAACTSFTGTSAFGREPQAIVELRRRIDDRAGQAGTLNRTAPSGVSIVTISRASRSRVTS